RAVPRAGAAVRGHRPGAGPAGRHDQDLAAPGPAGSAGAAAAAGNGPRRDRPRPGGPGQRTPSGWDATMNCPECQDLLQYRLDGRAPHDPVPVEPHLAGCADCREWYSAAGRLEDGLRLLTPPAPPSGLTDRVVALALADRRRRARRWAWAGSAAAVAAGLL